MTKEYTIEDVQNILRNELEKWERTTRIVGVEGVTKNGDRIVLQMIRTIRVDGGVVVEVKV